MGRSPHPGTEPAGMTMSPAELRHERPGRGLLGYRRTDVDRLLVEATVAYESVWRERADLQDTVHELQQEVSRHREGEQAMRNALITAERAADEMRASASRQAELIVREAEAKSRDLVHEAYAERERVRREGSKMQAEEAEFRLRLRALLGAILEAVRDHEQRLAGSEAARSPAPGDTQQIPGQTDDVVRAR
jgi:cell division initiation protein